MSNWELLTITFNYFLITFQMDYELFLSFGIMGFIVELWNY